MARYSAYWWVGRRNFGDQLTPLLLSRFSDLTVDWAPVAQADILAVGSILDQVPVGYPGIVAGSGKLFDASPVRFPRACILGLRGPLTARGVRGDYALGDPGLLAADLVPPVAKHYNLGIVSHWSDTTLATRPEFARYHPLIIPPTDNPLDVITAIGSCRKIVSSSLHGIIVADSFGIPRRTEMTPRFAREGGSFKFEDYAASLGMPFEVGVTQVAPRFVVEDRQSELFDLFDLLGRRLLGVAA